MATLNIPPRYREAVAKIRTLDDEAFEELRAAFGSVQPTSADREVSSRIAGATHGISAVDVEGFLESLIGLQIARSLSDASLELFAEDVVAEIERSQKSTLSAAERTKFSARIQTLLSFDSLAIAAKSRDLQTDHERVYLNARMITDLRPVFRGSADEPPAGVLILHMLRVTSLDRNNGERRSFYVAMDDDDVSNLKKLLERAELKGTTLRKHLDQTGIKILGRSRNQ